MISRIDSKRVSAKLALKQAMYYRQHHALDVTDNTAS